MTVTIWEILAFSLFVAIISLTISLFISPIILIPIFVIALNIILFLVMNNY